MAEDEQMAHDERTSIVAVVLFCIGVLLVAPIALSMFTEGWRTLLIDSMHRTHWLFWVTALVELAGCGLLIAGAALFDRDRTTSDVRRAREHVGKIVLSIIAAALIVQAVMMLLLYALLAL
ncbi:hypothetical protein [Bifidobacterium canis]|uniref:Uncharacterized protein n=1 Tax=Bifidobacterium canis TaxID=2610880 RepID=A0A7K1J472_9BIFI|nr:hypothetical protein [Bifidobacterium canis]MUH59453.1 hypothetical protein [Bifidobacterium canis]